MSAAGGFPRDGAGAREPAPAPASAPPPAEPLTSDGISARLEQARSALQSGQVSRSWMLIETLLDHPVLPSVRQQEALQYLQLACALYGQGDLDAARALNARLPAALWTTMRYRLSLRLRDPATARRLRHHPGNGPRELADFRTTAGLHEIWAHRYRTGFPLYAERWQAINFPRVLPDRVTHAPLPEDPVQDAPLIVLEQGLGEVLFQLAHIRAAGGHEDSTFTGLARYATLVRRYFPHGRFVAAGELPAPPAGQPAPPAHLGADFIARACLKNGSLAPARMLDTPRRHPLDLPVFGLCWRGGSGQNRREERYVPLPFLLDMLPLGARFLSLQYDLTDDERRLLTADPRCAVPLADLTRDPLQTIDMIRPLAGVISVDSANCHMAGFTGVPLLALMNRTSHWFWGPDADAASVFPSATTLPKENLSAPAIATWIDTATADWHRRDTDVIPTRYRRSASDFPERPLFVCGLPRSGTSMTMRVLAAHGLFLGETIPGNADNPNGYYENRRIRENHLKPILRALGADPRGIAPLPRTEALPPFPDLSRRLLSALREEGYDGTIPWGYKDPKLTLLWPLFARAFPHASWLILHRDRDKVLKSMTKASFLRHHSTSTEFWKPFCATYDTRLAALRASPCSVFTADADAIAAGDTSGLEPVCDAMGLVFDPQVARRALRRD